MQPKTWEVVLYTDGDGNVSECDRGENGHLTYVGREFFDAEQMAVIVHVLQMPPSSADAWTRLGDLIRLRAEVLALGQQG